MLRNGSRVRNINSTTNNSNFHKNTHRYQSGNFDLSRRTFSSSQPKLEYKKDEGNKNARPANRHPKFSKQSKSWAPKDKRQKKESSTSSEQTNEAFSSLLSSISKKPERQQSQGKEESQIEEEQESPMNITDLFKRIKPQEEYSELPDLEEEDMDASLPEPEYEMGEDIEYEYEDEPLPEKEFQMQSAIKNEFETALPQSSRDRLKTDFKDKKVTDSSYLVPDADKFDHAYLEDIEKSEDVLMAMYNNPEFATTLAKEKLRKRRFRPKQYSPIDPDPDIPYSPDRRVPDLTSEFDLTSIFKNFETAYQAKLHAPETYQEDQITREFLLNKLYSRLKQTKTIASELAEGFTSSDNIVSVAKQIQELCNKRIDSVIEFAKHFDCNLSEKIPEPLHDVITEEIGDLKVNPLPFAQHIEFIWLISHDLPRDAYLDAVVLEDIDKKDKQLENISSVITEDVKKLSELCNQLHLQALAVDKDYNLNLTEPPSALPEYVNELEKAGVIEEVEENSHPWNIYLNAHQAIEEHWPKFPVWEHIEDEGLPDDIIESWDRAIRIIRDDNIGQENWFSPYIYDIYSEGSRGKVRDMLDFARDKVDDSIFESKIPPPEGPMESFDPLGVGGTRSINADTVYELSNNQEDGGLSERSKFINYLKEMKKMAKLDPLDVDQYIQDVALDKTDLENLKSQVEKEVKEGSEKTDSHQLDGEEEYEGKGEHVPGDEEADLLNDNSEGNKDEDEEKNTSDPKKLAEIEAMKHGWNEEDIELSNLRDQLLPPRQETPPPPDISIPANVLESGNHDDLTFENMKAYMDWESIRTKNSFLDALEPLLEIPRFEDGDIFNTDYEIHISRMADRSTLNAITLTDDQPSFTPFEVNEQRHRMMNPDYSFQVEDFMDRDGSLIELFDTSVDKKQALERLMFPIKNFENDMAIGRQDVLLHFHRTVKDLVMGINEVELFEPMDDVYAFMFRMDQNDPFGLLEEPEYEEVGNEENGLDSLETQLDSENRTKNDTLDIPYNEKEKDSRYGDLNEFLDDPEFDYGEDQRQDQEDSKEEALEQEQKQAIYNKFFADLERLEEPEFIDELGTRDGISMPYDCLPTLGTGDFHSRSNPKGVHDLFDKLSEIDEEHNFDEQLEPLHKRAEERIDSVLDQLIDEDIEDEYLDDFHENFRVYADADYPNNLLVEEQLVRNEQRRVKRVKKFKAKRDKAYWQALKQYQEQSKKLEEEEKEEEEAEEAAFMNEHFTEEGEEITPDPDPKQFEVTIQNYDNTTANNEYRNEPNPLETFAIETDPYGKESDLKEESSEEFATKYMESVLKKEEEMTRDLSPSRWRKLVQKDPERAFSYIRPLEPTDLQVGSKIYYEGNKHFTGTLATHTYSEIKGDPDNNLPTVPENTFEDEGEDDGILDEVVDVGQFMDNPWLQNPIQNGKNSLEYDLEREEKGEEENDEQSMKQLEEIEKILQGEDDDEDSRRNTEDVYTIDTSSLKHAPHVLSSLQDLLDKGCVLSPDQINSYLKANSETVKLAMDINARKAPHQTDFLDSYDAQQMPDILEPEPSYLEDEALAWGDTQTIREIQDALSGFPELSLATTHLDLEQVNDCFRELGIDEIPEEKADEVYEDPHPTSSELRNDFDQQDELDNENERAEDDNMNYDEENDMVHDEDAYNEEHVYKYENDEGDGRLLNYDLSAPLDVDRMIYMGRDFNHRLESIFDTLGQEIEDFEASSREEGDFKYTELSRSLKEEQQMPSLADLEQHYKGVRAPPEEINEVNFTTLSEYLDMEDPEEIEDNMIEHMDQIQKLYGFNPELDDSEEAKEEQAEAEENENENENEETEDDDKEAQEFADQFVMDEIEEEAELPDQIQKAEAEEKEHEKRKPYSRHKSSPPSGSDEYKQERARRQYQQPEEEEEGKQEGSEDMSPEEQEQPQQEGMVEKSGEEDEEMDELDDETVRIMSHVLPSIIDIEHLQPYVDNIVRKQQLDFHVARPYIHDVIATRPAGKYGRGKVVAPYDKYFDEIVQTVPEGNLRDDLENVARAVSKNTTVSLNEKRQLVESYRDAYLKAVHSDPADYLFKEKMEFPTHLHDDREMEQY